MRLLVGLKIFPVPGCMAAGLVPVTLDTVFDLLLDRRQDIRLDGCGLPAKGLFLFFQLRVLVSESFPAGLFFQGPDLRLQRLYGIRT